MLFLFKSTPKNKKRKHSEHFLHHQEPLGSQRADRTYCTASKSVAWVGSTLRWPTRRVKKVKWTRSTCASGLATATAPPLKASCWRWSRWTGGRPRWLRWPPSCLALLVTQVNIGEHGINVLNCNTGAVQRLRQVRFVKGSKRAALPYECEQCSKLVRFCKRETNTKVKQVKN